MLICLGSVLIRTSSLWAAWQFFARLVDPANFTAGASIEAALLVGIFWVAHLRFRGFDLRTAFLHGPWFVPVGASAIGTLAILMSVGETSSPFIYFQF